MQAAKCYRAARTIQKFIRGRLTRKSFFTNMQGYLFFKKVERRVFVRDLVHSMQRAFLRVKETKQRMLKKYIFFCATRIQCQWRGFYARRVRVPVRAKLGLANIRVLEAVAMGWKVRRIMRTKEVVCRVQ